MLCAASLQKIADLEGCPDYTEQQLLAAQAQVTNLEENAGVPSVEETERSCYRGIRATVICGPHCCSAERRASRVVARSCADAFGNEVNQKAREVISSGSAEKQTELDEIDRPQSP